MKTIAKKAGVVNHQNGNTHYGTTHSYTLDAADQAKFDKMMRSALKILREHGNKPKVGRGEK